MGQLPERRPDRGPLTRSVRRSPAKPLAVLGVSLAAAALLLVPVQAQAASRSAVPAAAAPAAKVYVIQGISGQNLDVVVDGKVVLASAKPKTVVGPLTLKAGSHQVAVRDGSSDLAQSDIAVRAGQSLDVVAHPSSDSSASPLITAFQNDLAAVGRGKVRLTVAHTAAAPPADITVDGKVLFSDVANSEALTVVVPASTYRVAVVPAVTAGDPILGPVDLSIKAGTLTRVFAIGDVARGTMDAVVHAVPIGSSGAGAPSSVQTGDGGQLATSFTSSRPSPAWVLAAAVLLLAVAGAGAGLTRGRSRAAR